MAASGGVPVFRIPPPTDDARPRKLQPLLCLESSLPDLLSTPGSVSARRLACGRLDILVCNNYTHQVTQHLVDLDGSEPTCLAGSPLLARGLDIPDGVVHSPDGRWIAVSNHNEHCVRLYDAARLLGPDAEPDARLLGADYPHGLRLSASSRHVLVADAGAPFVYVYAKPEGGWAGDLQPRCRLRVLDEHTFLRGQSNPQEGGAKGLDIDRQGRVMVVTNEEVPLAFFDLGPLLGERTGGAPEEADRQARWPALDAQVWQRQLHGMAGALRRKDARLAHLEERLVHQGDRLRSVEQVLDLTRAELARSQQGLAALLNSRSWRLMAPYRRLGRLLLRWGSRS